MPIGFTLACRQRFAGSLGADAVLNVRFETSEIAQGSAEILAYGTAVRLA